MSQKRIIGIGASAGGLEALTLLISKLDPTLPYSFIVLQHLSPLHRSMMTSILARETTMPVLEATNGVIPQPGTIYVVPASHNAVLRDGILTLTLAHPEMVPRPSINTFFMSLAAAEEDRAIGILLSGTGSDGVAGLQAIKAMGGITLVQSPSEAKYDGMPLAAINADVVSQILTCEDIAKTLPKLMSSFPFEIKEDELPELLELVNSKLQYDFSGYKSGMLLRRVRRRMMATDTRALREYINFIQNNPQELEMLARDILISVTSFFRDPKAFETLHAELEKLIKTKIKGEQIRIWIAGCSTGEEAYSIAIILSEILGSDLDEYNIQIFATDLDEEALGVARRGIYSTTAIKSLPPQYLQRYFRRLNESWEVNKSLRDLLVFSQNNLVSDAPFLRLDLVSCRNVLIYFDVPLQVSVLQNFHFGLNPQGILLLGKSESVSQAEQLFHPIERSDRIFAKTNTLTVLPKFHLGRDVKPVSQRRDQRAEMLLQGLRQHFQITAILCDENGNIQHSIGEVEKFLSFPPGSPRFFLGEVITSDLRGEALTLYHRWRKTKKNQTGRPRNFHGEKLRLSVLSVNTNANTPLVLLIIPEQNAKVEADNSPTLADTLLEDELLSAREHLHTLLEEMAASNEEMQALNEEAHAANEELQASYEELEAANEELQAANEELVSLNEEFSRKANELVLLTNEYSQLYDSLPFAILVFDSSLRLMRFNAVAGRQLGLSSRSLTVHIGLLGRKPTISTIEKTLIHSLAEASDEEVYINQDGRVFQLEVTKGRNKDNDINLLIVTLIDRTEIMTTQRQLRVSQDRLTSVMGSTGMIFAMKALSGEFLYVNPRFAEFFDLSEQQIIGHTDFDLFPHGTATEFWSLGVEATRNLSTIRHEHTLMNKRGETVIIEAHYRALLTAEGRPEALLFEASDVTAQRELAHQQRLNGWIFEQTGDAIIVTDPNFIIQTCNGAVRMITDQKEEDLVNTSIVLLLTESARLNEWPLIQNALRESGGWKGELQLLNGKDSRSFPAWASLNRVRDANGDTEHFVISFSDISQLKRSQARAEYLSSHDSLTSLPNRSTFQSILKRAITAARYNKSKLAVLYVDVDNFKLINDTYGHLAGDEVLESLANDIKHLLGSGQIAARIGGDEFAILIPDATQDIVHHLGQAIIHRISQYPRSSRNVTVEVSIGSALFPNDSEEAESLMRAADGAMYMAKAAGRSRFQAYNPELRHRNARTNMIETALQQAVNDHNFSLVFQPIYDLTTTPPRPTRAEALVRWHDNSLGNVAPSEFIPAAESTGSIIEIDHWVHDTVLKQIKTWQQQNLVCLPIAINISPYTLREKDFMKRIAARHAAHNVPYDMIQIEITEHVFLTESPDTTRNMQALVNENIHISLDDFGSGYSTLNYLTRLPLNELKIDRTFIETLTTDTKKHGIVRAILSMANVLQLSVVAEGVETPEQLELLRAEGCALAQGYHLSKPIPASDFAKILYKINHLVSM